MDRLRVIPPYGKSFLHPVERESLIIGRSATVDLHVPDRFLSRRHARLFFDQGCWWIEDLASRNGSWINGRRIDRPTEFGAGDRVRLSNTYLLFGPEPDNIERTPTDFFAANADVSYVPSEDLSQSTGPLDPGGMEQAAALDRQAERLHRLVQVHDALSKPIDLEGLLDMILDCSFESLRADQGVIFLKQEDGSYQRAAERSTHGLSGRHFESETLLQRVVEEGMTALVNGLEDDSDWRHVDSVLDQGVFSLIAAPMKDDQGSLGMIALSAASPESHFGHTDLEVLVSLASIGSMRLRNMILTENAAKEQAINESLEEDLRRAQEIQQKLLPTVIPNLPGFDLYARSIPCRRVSGDFYQLIPRNQGNEVVILVADVVGKGLGASLVTTCLDSLAAGPIEVGHSPVEICRRLDRRLFKRTAPGKYAATLVAALAADHGRVCYTNAGLNPGLLLRGSGRVNQLRATGPPLGLFEGSTYLERAIRMQPGDLLVLYTDGITEATDISDREYGLHRLLDVCRRHRDQPLKAIAEAVESELRLFTGGLAFEDDRTLVLVRRCP